jgi:methionyl-tRNA synthetase
MKKTRSKRIIVTSALPYANGPIHIGHLVEYIQTDIFVRFLKLTGHDAVYCCADDAHGTPIEVKAQELGMTPKELIAKFYKEHLRDFSSFMIEFDSYYTTDSKENKHFSDLIFRRLSDKGLIYTKEIEATFCENCKRSLPDRYVKGKCPRCGAEDQYGDVCEACNAAYKTTDLIEPYCTICKSRPIRKKTEHYFFKLSAFSAKLKKWLANNKTLQQEVKNYVNNWIKDGLEDWDISRDGPYFGFKIPGEENKYYYVWLDAPIGYIASFANYLGKDVKKAELEWNNSRVIHFIGKDITYFHFLFWPAMLMGAGFELPETLVVHGFLTVNNEKMSKSRGTFFTAADFAKRYDAECLRYYYSSMLSKKLSDIDLNLADFSKKINNELVGNIGNFCYRVISFTNRNFNGKITSIDENEKIIGEVKKKISRIEESYAELNFNEAVKEINAVAAIGNAYFQENEPWKLVKADKAKAQKICGLCMNIAKNLSILIQPILPKFSKELQKQVKAENLKWEDLNFSLRNHKIGKEGILVKKIEICEEERFPLDLKVGKVVAAKNHPNADKLFVLEVDLGSEKRQLVAGLSGHYAADELTGKNIIVVSNLKPAKLRGIESKGMLLAAEDKGKVGLLTVENAKPGDACNFGSLKNSRSEISFDDFMKLKITAKNGRVFYGEKELRANGKRVSVERLSRGVVK